MYSNPSVSINRELSHEKLLKTTKHTDKRYYIWVWCEKKTYVYKFLHTHWYIDILSVLSKNKIIIVVTEAFWRLQLILRLLNKCLEQFPWHMQIILKMIKEDKKKLWQCLEMQKIIQLTDFYFIFISSLILQTNCI